MASSPDGLTGAGQNGRLGRRSVLARFVLQAHHAEIDRKRRINPDPSPS
jgi:hypothetical protein